MLSMWDSVFLLALSCSLFRYSANKLNLFFVGISGFRISILSVLLIFVTGAASDSDVDRLRLDTTLCFSSLCFLQLPMLICFSGGLPDLYDSFFVRAQVTLVLEEILGEVFSRDIVIKSLFVQNFQVSPMQDTMLDKLIPIFYWTVEHRCQI